MYWSRFTLYTVYKTNLISTIVDKWDADFTQFRL